MKQRHSDLDREFELGERVRANQQRLGATLRPQYDFIVCGAGTSGSVIARAVSTARTAFAIPNQSKE